MKIFVYGKTNDDKGTQLEALTAAILTQVSDLEFKPFEHTL